MKKSIWCLMGFHKMGEWRPESVLITGFPTEIDSRHCVRDGCEHTELASEGVLDGVHTWNYSYAPAEIDFDTLGWIEIGVNDIRILDYKTMNKREYRFLTRMAVFTITLAVLALALVVATVVLGIK